MDVTGVIAIIITAALFALGVPIFVSLAMGSVAFAFLGGLPTMPIGQVPFSGADKFPFLAIPLFVLTGDLIAKSGIAQKLVDLSNALIGWMRGALGMATIVAAGFFSAISGSNSATAAAFTGIMMKPLKKAGYSGSIAGAVISSAACTGIIIPPSITFIVYGAIASVSVGALNIGGTVPGILMIIFMCIANYIVCKKEDIDPPITKFSFRNVLKATWEARHGLVAPLIILGSMFFGIATPTEAAAVAVLYCLFVGLLTRQLKWADLPELLVNSGIVCGIIIPIITLAVLFGQMLSLLRIPDAFVSALLSVSDSKFVLMTLLFLMLFVLGCVMETTPIILILTPLLEPVIQKIGLDPVHWGVCFVSTLAVGFITPPVGLNIYVVSSQTKIPVMDIAWKAIPYVVALIISLIFIYALPWLTLFPVELMK